MFKALREPPEWGETRGWDPHQLPWMRISDDPHIQPIRSYVFQRDGSTEVVMFQFPTFLACGSKAHLHGGYAAMYLDDLSGALCRNAPDSDEAVRKTNTGMTGYLKVDYKKLLRCLQWLCFRVKQGEQIGRKFYVHGSIQDLEGYLLTTSEWL